jgi:ABC-2 type transport system ATP-binding protein
VVEISNLGFGYTRERLFSGLDVHLDPGNIYGLLGKNGAGKTTLLKLICGLRFPQEGECRVLGYDPQRRPAELLQEICFIPEEFYVPPLNGSQYEALYAAFFPRFDHGAFQDYVREFQLDTRKKLSELSYGQKKKFLLAFGLASGSRLLLLDEPTNGLDIPSKSQFRKLLARAGDAERTILISTHQVRDMENLIDPIIILDEGKIIFQQPMEQVTRRLSVHLEPVEPAPGTGLYADKVLGGYVVVSENKTGEDGQVDLEILFNAVTTNREGLRALFERAPVTR